MNVFERLRSVQFDPIAPVGCNHDLVFRARLQDYRIGDWQQSAYRDRLIYDGWDKMASLVPFEGWPIRRIIYDIHRHYFQEKIFEGHSEAVNLVLRELQDRGALMPREFHFQQRNEKWKGSWFGPSVTKQVLKALWHTGQIMTTGRLNGQHIYDLTERVVPERFRAVARLSDVDARCELVLDRHRAMGVLRPSAPPEVWSGVVLQYTKRDSIRELVGQGRLVPIEVDGVLAHCTPQFLRLLDEPDLEPSVRLIAPLDPFLWDRKMVKHLFDFDYIWEIYVPEPKRKWGYYVLPILYGNNLLARIELWARDGILEVRRWHSEGAKTPKGFREGFRREIKRFMLYCNSHEIVWCQDAENGAKELGYNKVRIPN